MYVCMYVCVCVCVCACVCLCSFCSARDSKRLEKDRVEELRNIHFEDIVALCGGGPANKLVINPRRHYGVSAQDLILIVGFAWYIC